MILDIDAPGQKDMFVQLLLGNNSAKSKVKGPHFHTSPNWFSFDELGSIKVQYEGQHGTRYAISMLTSHTNYDLEAMLNQFGILEFQTKSS
jgi:hypothetical protein